MKKRVLYFLAFIVTIFIMIILNGCVESGDAVFALTAKKTKQVHKHMECIEDQCEVVDGKGISMCTTDEHCKKKGNISVVLPYHPPYHFECRNYSCMKMPGEGEDQCQNHTECIPKTHKICMGNRCVSVNRPGISQCRNDFECSNDGGGSGGWFDIRNIFRG